MTVVRAILILATGQSEISDIEYYGADKSLLKIGGLPGLSWLYKSLSSNEQDRICIVTSGVNYKPFERWAMANNFPMHRILCTGIAETRTVSETLPDALSLSLKLISSWSHQVLIVSADFLPEPESLHLLNSNVVLTCQGHSPVVMCVPMTSVKEYGHLPYKNFVSCLVNSGIQSVEFNGKVLSEWMRPEFDIEAYENYWSSFMPYPPRSTSKSFLYESEISPIKKRVHARIGLMGNPSDGFFGKTIACTIQNYWADVILIPNIDSQNEEIDIVVNELCDPIHFVSIDMVKQVCDRDGYHGARRLFMATISLFVKHCQAKKIPISHQGFQIVYHTTIPRQVGLAGSSALVTGLLKGLVEFNHISESDFPLWEQANLCLSAERDELGITAGYQDRVVQAHGGCVYMDFEKSLMESRGYGIYESISLDCLPFGIWMAYVREAEESGKIHKNIRALFNAGDTDVIKGMSQIADLAVAAKKALENKDSFTLATLMNQNFDLRRQVYGDVMIGHHTRRLIDIARSNGHAAKQSGSGGCVIGLWAQPDDNDRELNTLKMQSEMRDQGYIFSYIDLKF